VIRVRGWLLASVLPLLASPAAGQLGEAQLGVLASYGTGRAYGPGAGLVLGVATGRLAYIGVRWAYQVGTTRLAGPAAPSTEIRNRAQVFAVDLGIQIPAGVLEIVPGVSLGALRFSQHTRAPAAGGGTTERAQSSTEFLAAPGVSVEVYAGRLAFIPQLQYALVGDPDLPFAVEHHGLIASLRIVVTKEMGRIRR
jgi:hypothetical protein